MREAGQPILAAAGFRPALAETEDSRPIGRSRLKGGRGQDGRLHFVLAAIFLWAGAAFAQNQTGELHLTLGDQIGQPVQSPVELSSQANNYRRTFETDHDGKLVVPRLPFGLYRVLIAHEGFTRFAEIVEVRSAIPLERAVTLMVADAGTTVVVSDSETLLDPHRTGSPNRIGAEALNERASATPGRALADLVDAEPGWVLEANAVLHPRGSEYQTQYVVNGIPLTDNRSPAFAPEIDADDVQSMNVLTANYPAEYGRKLGGVIEVSTTRDSRPGFHGKVELGGGSFATEDGFAQAQYGWGGNTLSLSGDSARTGRYLDPPVLQNYTNSGSTGSFGAHYERDFGDRDRVGAIVRREQARFQVPNEQVQQEAGQRQDRDSYETVGTLSWQHVFSPNLLGDVRGMARDLSASLWSNPLTMPILAWQDRGFREEYFKGSLAAHVGAHELKAGVEADFGSLREAFQYRIADPSQFDPGTPPAFQFAARQPDREQGVFVQDLMRWKNWTFSAGLRWDHYRLVVQQSAASPRLGAAWYWRAAGIVMRASYDRAFQTPAFENLLLASSAAVAALNDNVLRLPVRPSAGNFYEAGVSKALWQKLRLDANYFRRTMNNYADDDLLLNTGVSFPIAFRKADIHGMEAKLELPRWGPLSGSMSYSNMLGIGYLPVTGGLFLGGDAASVLNSSSRFPVSQDQRNTVHGRVRYQIAPRMWMAWEGSYGSGLPAEFDGQRADALAQYGSQIVDRVNFARGRVRPSFSLDASAGVNLWKREHRTLSVEASVLNLTDRLNVINFAGLFSGTAVATPRGFSVRMMAEF